jgi:signal transduction histidine kinase
MRRRHTLDDDRTLRHDLGQALGAMSAVLAVIEADPLHAGSVVPRLDQLRRQAEWMASVLIERGGHPRPTDVGDAVADVWSATGRDAVCTVQLRREQVPPAMVDPAALRRALRNLVDNALRAAGTRGRVEVTVRSAAAGIVVEVADDGPGFGQIPAQQGLGLASARRFAAATGGNLTVGASRLGGVAVRMQLPALPIRRLTTWGDTG